MKMFLNVVSTLWENPFLIVLAFTAGLGGLLGGFDSGLMSGNFLSLEEDVLSQIQPVFEKQTLYIYLIGAMFGASIAGGFRICSKKIIMVGDSVFITGTVISCSSSVAAFLTIGKGLMGFGLGWLFTGGPLLIFEGSPPQIRGTLGSCFGIMLNTGIFFAYGAATVLADVLFSWRILYLFGLLFALVQLYLVWKIVKEPPVIPLKKADVCGGSAPMSEEQKEEEEEEEKEEEEKEKEISVSLVETQAEDQHLPWNAVITTALIGVIQQLAGLHIILYIMNGTSVILFFVSIAGSFAGSVLVNQESKKVIMLVPLFILSIVLYGLSLEVEVYSSKELGVSHYLKEGFFPTMLVYVYIMVFSGSFALLPWAVSLELFPIQYRGVGAAVANLSVWGTSTFISSFFLRVIEAIGVQDTILIVATFCACTFFVGLFIFPEESKGLSIRETQHAPSLSSSVA